MALVAPCQPVRAEGVLARPLETYPPPRLEGGLPSLPLRSGAAQADLIPRPEGWKKGAPWPVGMRTVHLPSLAAPFSGLGFGGGPDLPPELAGLRLGTRGQRRKEE